VCGARNLKEARGRYHEQFGLKYDDRKIDIEIGKLFRQWYESPPPNIDIPAYLIVAIQLRKGAAGSQRGPWGLPLHIQRQNFRALVWARRRVRRGEKLDDVVKAAANRCSLSEAEIRNRLQHPARYGLTKYDRP